jgi:hypothetical protein
VRWYAGGIELIKKNSIKIHETSCSNLSLVLQVNDFPDDAEICFYGVGAGSINSDPCNNKTVSVFSKSPNISIVRILDSTFSTYKLFSKIV